MRVELFAYPAWHSLSPAMHNAAFERLGIEARYAVREVMPADLPRAVAGLRQADALGANVTLPHKESVLPLLDTLTPEAAAVGAVNTVVRRGTELEGHNTDVTGFLRALADLGVDVDGRRVLLLGAGGAARAVTYALLVSGAAEVLVHNRTEARAQRLAADFAGHGAVRSLAGAELREAAAGSRLLVNATSVGLLREGLDLDESPFEPTWLPAGSAVMDLVYRPPRTRLLRDASAAGLATQNGLPMLVYQGAEAFTLWTGREAPAELMRRAAESVLAG